MLMLITLLNDGTLIAIGYDLVKPSISPEQWSITYLFIVSSVLGAIACTSSLLLLWAALDSNNPDGLFATVGIPPLEYGKIVTGIYLKVSPSNFLTLFSARTQEDVFSAHRPGKVILFAASFSLAISTVTILACWLPEGTLDRTAVMGLAHGDCKLMPLWIWLYSILFCFIQDSTKIICISSLQVLAQYERK
jgi:H+-transporting ATPase